MVSGPDTDSVRREKVRQALWLLDLVAAPSVHRVYPCQRLYFEGDSLDCAWIVAYTSITFCGSPGTDSVRIRHNTEVTRTLITQTQPSAVRAVWLITPRERTGLVGGKGTGKSTLPRVVA